MTVDLERRLRHELAAAASATRTDPDALPAILARAGVAAPRRPWLSWPRALVLAVVLALLVAGAMVVGEGDGGSTVLAGLPRRPPAIEGSVLAMSRGGSYVRTDLAAPGRVDEVFPATGAAIPLADGRTVSGTTRATFLLDPAGGPSVALPVEVGLESAASMPDGRVAMIVAVSSFESGRRRRVLRTFDPSDGSFTDRRMPSGFLALQVAAGPDGSLAVLGERAGAGQLPVWEHPELLIISPDGQRRLRLGGLAGRRDSDQPATLSWGPSGLIAVTTHPHPIQHPRLAQVTWTLVIDARTGHLVRAIDGFQGQAWSPDGSGLLTARRTGPDSSQLAVWWGPGLTERIDLGTTDAAVTPRIWLP